MVIVTEEIKNAFNTLILEAQKQVKENTDVEMVVVTQSAKGNMYFCFIHEALNGDEAADIDDFIQRLVDAGDVEMKYCVCMWNRGWLEIPSYYLRKCLLEISPKNEETIFAGQGENKIVLKTLKDMMP